MTVSDTVQSYNRLSLYLDELFCGIKGTNLESTLLPFVADAKTEVIALKEALVCPTKEMSHE